MSRFDKLRPARPSQKLERVAFTRIELLVVIATIIIVAGMSVLALQRSWEDSNRKTCVNNLKRIGIATLAIHDVHRSLPPLAAESNAADLSGLKGPYRTSNTGLTLFVRLLPFLENDSVYQAVVAAEGVTPEIARMVCKPYLCPSETSSPHGATRNGTAADIFGYAASNYLANYLVFGNPHTGSLAGTAKIPATFIDGTSNTIFYAEGYGSCGSKGGSLWADIDLSNDLPYSYLPAMCVCSHNGVSTPKGNPGQLFPFGGRTDVPQDTAAICNFTAKEAFQVLPSKGTCAPQALQSPHPDGINVCLGDGSVRFTNRNVSVTTWNHLCDPRDGSPNQGGDW